MDMPDPDGLWPMVYQGLGVYREPVQRPMMSLPAPSLLGTAPGPQDDLLTLPSLGSMPYTPRSSDAGAHACPAQIACASPARVHPIVGYDHSTAA